MPEKQSQDIEDFANSAYQKTLRFFDHIEDKARGYLSHHPIWYALVAGVGIVLFWRGIWGLADAMALNYFLTLLISVGLLLLSGTFVSFFIGDQILLSGLKAEKRLAEKTEKEVRAEEAELMGVFASVEMVRKDLEGIKATLAHLEEKIERPKPLRRKTSPKKAETFVS